MLGHNSYSSDWKRKILSPQTLRQLIFHNIIVTVDLWVLWASSILTHGQIQKLFLPIGVRAAETI